MSDKISKDLVNIIKTKETVTTEFKKAHIVSNKLIGSFDRLMSFVDKHLDDRFYIENNQRIDVRNKIEREICSNLLMHREFASPYPAKLIIEKECLRTENANRAKMIGELTPESYEPYPKNPKIAKVFKEIGLADELGSGVQNLYKYTPIYSEGAEPELKENDIFRTIIPINNAITAQDNGKNAQDNGKNAQVKVSEDAIISFCNEAKSLKEIVECFGYKNVRGFREKYINILLRENKLKQTVPDKPRSRNQKYYSE